MSISRSKNLQSRFRKAALSPKNSCRKFICGRNFFLDKYIAVRYTVYIEARYIEARYIQKGVIMENRIRRIYVPMTETGFYILFCLQRPQHGYGIGQQVKEMTENAVIISPGTMYGTLSKMEKDGLIAFFAEEENRKLYRITPLGQEVLETEIRRIARLYHNSKGEKFHD